MKKLKALKRFMHNGSLLNTGDEFEVESEREADEYTKGGLASETGAKNATGYDTKQVKANKHDTEFAQDHGKMDSVTHNMANSTLSQNAFGGEADAQAKNKTNKKSE